MIADIDPTLPRFGTDLPLLRFGSSGRMRYLETVAEIDRGLSGMGEDKMKVGLSLVILVVGMILFPSLLSAQNTPSAAETVDNIRLQLIDLSDKEESAKLRAQQLDEALKPENIERSLAGVGSTMPEELREQRRRQLTVERTTVTAQLEALATQRAKLEAALATAQTEAYHQSAKGSPVENQFSLTQFPRWLTALGLIALFGIAVCAAVFIKLRISTNR